MNYIASKQGQVFFCAALLLLMASGCVRSIQPIVKDEQLTSDDRVLGSWVSSDGQTSGKVSPTDDHKAYKLKYLDKDGKEANFVFGLARLGDMTIADITVDDPIPTASDIYKMHLLPLHSLIVVKQTTPQLVIKMMDSDWLSNCVQAHPAELSVFKRDKDDMIITATTDDLQAFVPKHANDPKFFGDDAVYVRPGDPTTRPAATQKAG